MFCSSQWRTSQRFLLWFVAVCAATHLTAFEAHAGWRHRVGWRGEPSCGGYADSCDVLATCAAPPIREVGRWETETVMVPQVSYKTVMRPVVTYRPEIREKTITVRRLVPETRQVAKVETVMVPVQRVRKEHYVSVSPSWEDVERDVPVLVPQRKTLSGTRTVCRPVMVEETETVLRDAGHFESRKFVDCAGCVKVCRVWVPKMVEEEVPVTVCKMRLEEVPYSCEVTVCRPSVKQITERVYKPVYTDKTREVPYTELVPKQVERLVEETYCREVAEDKVIEYCAMVRHTEEVAERVPVTTLVPKQVRRWVCRPVVGGKDMNAGKHIDDGPPPPNAPPAPEALPQP